MPCIFVLSSKYCFHTCMSPLRLILSYSSLILSFCCDPRPLSPFYFLVSRKVRPYWFYLCRRHGDWSWLFLAIMGPLQPVQMLVGQVWPNRYELRLIVVTVCFVCVSDVEARFAENAVKARRHSKKKWIWVILAGFRQPQQSPRRRH